MIRILLCSEGVTEHGHKEYRDGKYVRNDGVLQLLMRKLAGGLELSFVVKTREDIKDVQLLPKNFEGKESLRARKLASLAQQEKCIHIAYHRDEDNNGFDAMYNQVHGYFVIAKGKGMHCIAIIPMHMTESWLLADAGAFPSTPNNPALPTKPEEIWGNTESDSHPKKYITRVLHQYHKNSSTETYSEIARNIDIGVARARCPISFGKFYEDMKVFL